MPFIRISEGVAQDPGDLLSVLTSALGDAEVTSGDATSATLMLGASPVTLTGVNFSYLDVGDATYLVDGRLDAVHIDVAGLLGYDVDFWKLRLDIGDLIAAAAAEAGGDLRALDRLLLQQNWVYFGNSVPESHRPGETDPFGVVLNFRGDDKFVLEFGDDRLWSGDGDDTILGGMGNDSLYGGRGDDSLRGGAQDDLLMGNSGNDSLDGSNGDDTLVGGAGDDTLLGGRNNDVLNGNTGIDLIDGGAEDDLLRGGAEADVFRFEPGDGRDTIADFVPGEDVIQLQGVASFELIERPVGTILRYDGGAEIVLRGVEEADLGPGDILLV